MKSINWIEINLMNVISFSVVGWLTSFLSVWSAIIAVVVGISVIALNCIKFKSMQLDNKIKEIEIKEKNKRNNKIIY